MFDCIRNIVLYGTYGPTLGALIFFLYLCRLRANEETVIMPAPSEQEHDQESEEAESIVSKSIYLRLIMFCVTVTLISLCAVVTLVRNLLRLLSIKVKPATTPVYPFCPIYSMDSPKV